MSINDRSKQYKNIISEPYQFAGFINQSKKDLVVQAKKEICQKFNADILWISSSRVDNETRVICIHITSNLPEEEREKRDKLWKAYFYCEDGEEREINWRKYMEFEDNWKSLEKKRDVFTLSSSMLEGKKAIKIDSWTEEEAVEFLKSRLLTD